MFRSTTTKASDAAAAAAPLAMPHQQSSTSPLRRSGLTAHGVPRFHCAQVTQGMIKNIKALGRKAVVVVTPTPAWPHLVLQTMCPDFYQSMQMRGFFPGALET